MEQKVGNETTVNERLKLFAKANKITRKVFADSAKLSETALNNKLSGQRGIEIEMIQNVLLSFPNLSAEWLLRGNGDMMLSASKDEKPTREVELLQKQIELLEKNNADLRDEIQTLKKIAYSAPMEVSARIA